MKHWLEAHELVDGKHLGYPVGWTNVDGQPVQTIYAWHTNLRREYSKLRREKKVFWNNLSRKVREAKRGTS